jgi:NADPH2:quinone reductase
MRVDRLHRLLHRPIITQDRFRRKERSDMRAVQMMQVGGPGVLRAVNLPDPSLRTPTQVKIRVRAAGVNPVDTKIRSRGLFFPGALPAILGLDGAGVVEEVGAAVTRFRPGDEVWYCNGGLGGEPGNYAQYQVAEEAVLEAKPRSLDFTAAAAAPLVLLTAYEALFDRARLQPGQTVLVHAGAGGVGHVAIQLAKLGGARVLTTVSTADKAGFARALGADETVDYRSRDWVQAVLDWTGGRGADIVLDTVGPEVFKASIPAVAHYGDLVTLLDPGPVDWKEARTRNLRIGFELMLTPMLRALPEARAHQGEILRRCAEWIDGDRLGIQVGEVFPLERAADAHRLIEQGHVQGKLVLTPA